MARFPPQGLKSPMWGMSQSQVSHEWDWFWQDLNVCFAFWEGGGPYIQDYGPRGIVYPINEFGATRYWCGDAGGLGVRTETGPTSAVLVVPVGNYTNSRLAFTVLSIITRNDTPAGETNFIGADSGSNNYSYYMGWYVTDTTRVHWRIPGAAGGTKDIVSVTPYFANGERHIYIGTKGPSSPEAVGNRGIQLWIDGNLEVETQDNGLARTQNTGIAIMGSTTAHPSMANLGTMELAVVWNKRLTPQECRQISADPYGPFRQVYDQQAAAAVTGNPYYAYAQQ